MKKNTKVNYQYLLDSFMTNVNRLSINGSSQRANSDMFGTVKILKSAAESKNGKRQFTVSNAPIKSGRYSFAGMKAAYAKVIG